MGAIRPPSAAVRVVVLATAAAVTLPVVLTWQPGDDLARLVLAVAAVLLTGLRVALSLTENIRLLAFAHEGVERQTALAELARRALAGTDVDTLTAETVELADRSLGPDYAVVRDGGRSADAAFLDSLANMLATAIDRAKAEQEIRALAAARIHLVAETLASGERERRRIAEGLHDYPLQEVLAAGQELDELEAPPGRARECITRAREGLGRAVRDLRETVTDLHPVVLGHAGLEAALEALVRGQEARAGFDYELAVDADAARGNEETLLSIARELVGNVAKHARAGHVTITVEPVATGVALEVCDDGVGAEPERVEAAARTGHIGLVTCRERVQALDGTMAIDGAPGGGTRVRVELPAP